MSDVESPGNNKRSVINANLDIQNLVDLSSQKNIDLLTSTLDQIANLLIPHCGPHSEYGMIVTDNGGSKLMSPSIFTKDGIKLLSFIEYVSIIQTYIKNTIAYVGKEVDAKAKDGTTTAMIISAYFLINAILAKEEIRKFNFTTNDLEKIYKEVVIDINTAIKEHCFSLDRLIKQYPDQSKNDLVGIIAYIQALSSSGGNVELANCMKEIFTNSPEEAWEYQVWYRSLLENDTPFYVKTEPFDYKVVVDFQTMDILNAKFDTEWIEEDVEVLAIPEVINGQSAMMNEIQRFVTNFDPKRSLCLVFKNASGEFISFISKINLTREKPVALAYVFERERAIASTNVDVAALCAIASTEPYVGKNTNEPLTSLRSFTAKKVRYVGHELHFYGLFDHKEGVTCIHPNKIDPNKCPFYTELLNQLTNFADNLSVSHNKDQELRHKTITVIKEMTCIHSPVLYLGGTTHDVVSNELVAQDVLGAIMTSIKGDFFINGTISMFSILEKVKENYRHYSRVKFMIVDMFSNAIYKIIKHLYKDLYVIDDTMITTYDCTSDEYHNVLSGKSKSTLSEFITGVLNGRNPDEVGFPVNDYPVIQPVVIYQEIMTRVGELLLRLISTDKIIIPGGVYLDS